MEGINPHPFTIYINDLFLACKKLDVILFADDTNLTAAGAQTTDVVQDLLKLMSG